MSLLLEALKKAELAKQLAKAESGAGAPDSAQAPAEPSTPVITRERLPEISQPLEILSDDLPSPAQKRGEESPARVARVQESDPFAPDPDALPDEIETTRGAERAQARQLFEVKEMDYNPRRPFYLSLAVLGLVGVGYAGYVWWQTRPKQYFAVAPVAAPPASPSVATAPPPPPPAEPQSLATAGAPTAAAPAQTTAPEAAKVKEIPPIQPTRPRARPRPPRTGVATVPRQSAPSREPDAAVAPRPDERITPIAINAPVVSVDPQLEQAYQAFQRNDLQAARDGYQRVLAREPTNRDALLGLAAISVRTGDLDSAEARYLRLLELDPRDTRAASSLIALHGQLDPVASESRLKTLIALQPEAAPLYFVLGNQYAKQLRWPEAQEAYFKAYSVNPENADYAFNLAVSLDQLRQSKAALQYYQRALVLTEQRAASFSRIQVSRRAQELSK